MRILYGIPNCDSVKKAQNWLNKHQMDYQLHDYKKSGIDAGTLKKWCKEVGVTLILNKKSTTWRTLTAKEQSLADTVSGAIQLMEQHTSLIKRPVITLHGKVVAVGFSETGYAALLEA